MTVKKLTLKQPEKVPHMVFVEGRSEPKLIHDSFDIAFQEAERLAQKEPNRLVRVLKVVTQLRGEVRAVSVPLNDDEEGDSQNEF